MFRRKVFFYVHMVCLACCLRLHAQDPVAIRYTVDHGLPSNEVYDVHQDRRGYLWFATDHGIARYDGYAFKKYSTQDGLSDNTVFGFTADPDGRIWMRCMNGTLSYMDDTGIHAYPYISGLRAAFPKNWIETFTIDDHYQMYLTAGNCSFVLDLPTGKLKRIVFPSGTNAGILGYASSTPFLGVDTLMEQPNETFQIVEDAGSLFWRNPYQMMLNIPQTNYLTRPVGIACGNKVFVGSLELHLFLVENGVLVKNTRVSNKVNTIYLDRQGDIWLAGQGLLRFNRKLVQQEALFDGEDIYDILQDSEGSYWLTTTNGVLFIRNLDFRLHERVGDVAIGDVNRLRLVDSTLFVQHNGSKLMAIALKKGNVELEEGFSIALPSFLFHDFFPMPEKNIVIINKMTYAIDPQKRVDFSLYPLRGIPSGTARYYSRSAHRLLIATNAGIIIRDLQRRRWVWAGNEQRLFCNAVVEDARGRVWMGMLNGLFTFDGKNFLPFHHDAPIFRERVTSLVLLPNDGLAVGTRGQGVVLISQDGVKRVDKSHGLVSNLVDRLFLGASGLWVCTNEGLSLVKMETLAGRHTPIIENFNQGNGLPSDKINDVVEFGGHAYVATPRGLVIFKVDHQRPAPPMPPIDILRTEASGRKIMRGTPLGTDEDNLQFEFIAPLLSMPGKAEYEYMLAGRDADWNPAPGRTAAYYDLPPGQYTFKVRARAPGGNWSPQPASLVLELPEKYHEASWFRWGISTAVVLCLLLLTRLYIRSRQRRIHLNLNRLQAEIKALRSQMRPHFIFNALNSIQHLILLNDNATAQVHLARFAKLMRNILEASHHETIPVSSEIDILQLYLELEKLRFGDAFVYAIELQQGADWEHCTIPPMLLQPIVENAIWHGLRMQKKNPTLWLRFSRLPEGNICCEVEDNGIGRAAAGQAERTHPGTSVGLSNIQERIRLINATHPAPIRMETHDLLRPTGEASGTLVKLFIPLQKYVGRKN